MVRLVSCAFFFLGSLPHQIAYRGSLGAAIVNEQIELYGMTYDIYIYIYTHTDSGSVLIVSVGLAQARTNNIELYT